MLVLEGPDNSGKSTLGKALGLQYFSAGPAPKSVTELQECLNIQQMRAGLPCVQDRLTCISHQVYSEDLTKGFLQSELERLVKVPTFLIVYCRPPERVLMDLSTHKVKSYDTEEHMAKIIANQHIYIQRYDELMANIPHVQYDWTDEDISHEFFIQSMIKTQYEKHHWDYVMEQVSYSGGFTRV